RNSRRGRVVASVINEPIVVRLTQPVRNMPIGTELGYRDVADAIAALGAAHYFEVVRTQDGDPIPPLTPEEIEEAQRAARNRAKSRRLIIGADLDPIIPGPDKVVVGTASGTKQVDVSTLGGDVDPEVVTQRVSEELAGRNLLEGPSQTPPRLALSPDGSATPDGAVTPSKVGDVATVAGTYGQAWRYTATGQRMEVANVGYLDRNAGTVIVRARFEASVGSGSQAVLSTTSEAFRVTLQRISNNRLQLYIGTPVSSVVSGNNAIPDDTLVTLAFAWANGSVSLYVNGAPVGTGTFTTGSANPATLYTALSGGVYPYQAESYLFFDDRLPDDEIARISGLNEAHTIATVTVGGDLVLPSQRTVLGTEGGSALSLRSPSNALMDLTVSDDGTLLLDGREVGGAPSSPLIVTKAGDDVTITTPLPGPGTLEIWTDHGDPGQNDVFN